MVLKKKFQPLTNFDITKLLKNVRNFRGVYCKDLTPDNPKKGESMVVNLQDSSDGNGTHWVAMVYGKDYEYFDPFGIYLLHAIWEPAQSADCMVTVQTKDPSKTCDSFSKFQRNLRFSARINSLTKLPNLKENNLCLFDNGYYSFSCL